MISVHTRDELERAVFKAKDDITVADPKLCYDLIKLRNMTVNDKRLLYFVEMKGYQLLAKKALGHVEVRFLKEQSKSA